uniref:Facilitated trehalose transporter Tret1 n=3 Tax=Lygus hesperus TaxID=30085 RepID=A0A0A9YBC8_LYGHE
MSGIAIAEMYVSEITHESIRGMFMSFCTVQINIGILVAYALGKSLNYVAFNTLYVIVPFMCFLLVLYIPESPHFLMERQRKDDAMKSMLWLKNGDQTVAELELQAIERAGNNQNEKASVKQIWNDKASRSAMLIGVLSFSFQTLSGIHPVLNYAGIIFEESSSFLSPDDSSIVTAVILLVASIVNVMLIEGFGRKPLLYVSLIGSTICLSVLSVFLFALSNGVDVGNLGFVPVASISSFVFMYGIGLAAVPNALTNEVSPTNIRPAMGGAASITSTLILIAVLQSFPFLDEKIGLYFVFVIPVFTNIAGVFFTWFVVPETKGKTLLRFRKS